ncbi:hypothetical protein AUJ14_00425 [Candidatus Micrarchaeota archaeon CG1_02_55_22]|nr:MAG: hypothetical protein AUJ14_00425 [Candidatus Micrarchaeota archaeon CG1_02_55_22]
MIILIACVAANRVIGRDGDQPIYLEKDLQRFRALTRGKPVIMGRKTFEAISAKIGGPLPKRPNIVVTHQAKYKRKDVIVCHSVPEALEKAKELGTEVFVIGGQQLFEAALPLADRLELTEVHKDLDGDTYFPVFDSKKWHELVREVNEEGGIDFDFVTYERIR